MGIVALAGAAGCFASNDEAEGETAGTSKVVAQGDTSAVLKSTLLLETGCTAAKVGPRHLLLAARCINSKFAAGKSVRYTVASTGGSAPIAARDAGADASTTTTTTTGRAFKIEDVKVHPSYEAKCKTDVCAHGNVDASDAADVAVVILDADLETVPSLPVDLDAVGQADPLLVVSSGCSAFDAKDGADTRTAKLLAIPAQAVAHESSAYAGQSDLVARVAASYVVTAGTGWQEKGTKLCASDIGAPVFRGGSAAVAGVTSTFTTFGATTMAPATIEHTRVDARSRFKVGDWLSSLGVLTIHSCSEAAGGCVKREYDGGLPQNPDPVTNAGDEPTAPGDGDAGSPDAAASPDAALEEPGVRAEPLPTEDDSYESYGDEEDYSDAGIGQKKKSKEAAGCSASPSKLPSGNVGLGLGLALGLVLAARRKR